MKVENVKRLDEPVTEMPVDTNTQSRAPAVIRAPGELPKAVVEACNFARLPCAPWCETCIAAKGCVDQFHKHAEEKVISQVQIDCF